MLEPILLRAGVRGTVLNRRSEPIARALLTIHNRTVGFRTNERGEFWRILLPGSYTLLVRVPLYFYCTGSGCLNFFEPMNKFVNVLGGSESRHRPIRNPSWQVRIPADVPAIWRRRILEKAPPNRAFRCTSKVTWAIEIMTLNLNFDEIWPRI